MADLPLSFAACEYDHVRDLAEGRVKAKGIEIIPMLFEEPHFVFQRAMKYEDFDIAEMSFGRYISMVSRRANDMTAIPVFPSRVARISSFYVPSGSKLKSPGDLKGKRVGIPEWTQTASIYSRGWLAESCGVDLKSIEWVQTGVDEPGRPEPSPVKLPKGIRVRPDAEYSLSELLVDGGIDCAMTALPPKPFRDGDGRVRRLVKDSKKAEIAYFKETGIFPIMHVIAVRNEVLAGHPWVAVNLLEAFEQSKRNAIERTLRGSHSAYPIPWGYDAALEARELFGGDVFPYGLEPNRTTIESFLRFGHAQGVAHRKLKPEDLFVPSTLERILT